MLKLNGVWKLSAQENSVSVLLIDIGNTRIKWQTRQRGRSSRKGIPIKTRPHYARPDSIDEVAVSSVSTNKELRELFSARYGNCLRWIVHPVEGHAGFHHCSLTRSAWELTAG